MRHLVVENFFMRAEECRDAFEAHFSRANVYGAANTDRGVWDYFFVPDLYAYLRGKPGRILPEALVAAFLHRLKEWSVEHLGLGDVSDPTLSLYVSGCGQGLHNDAVNGRFGYVYSLTRWDSRTFSGGETMLMRDDDYWHSERLTQPAAGSGVVCLVPARFNQLLVFDDRIVHGVPFVQGRMDPLHGRLVLHGHLRIDRKHVFGALSLLEVDAVWGPRLPALEEILGTFDGSCHGLVTLRIVVDRSGAVVACTSLVDTLLATSRDAQPLVHIRTAILDWARALRFPQAEAASTIFAPFGLSSE